MGCKKNLAMIFHIKFFRIHKWTIVSQVNSMNMNKSQFNIKSIIALNIYIYIYFKLRQVKRFLLKIMGGGLEKAQKQFFWGEPGGRLERQP